MRDELFPGVKFDPDVMYRQVPKGTNTTRVTVSLDEDTYRMVQDLIHNPALHFGGDLSAFFRDAALGAAGKWRAFLKDSQRTALSRVFDNYRRVSIDRAVTLIGDTVDTKFEVLEVLTEGKNWSAITETMAVEARSVDEYGQVWQQVYVAKEWLRHVGVTELRRQWSRNMPPEMWRSVDEVFKHFENLVVTD